MSTLPQTIHTVARTFDRFTARAGGIQMRDYQLEAAQAVLDSIRLHHGHTIVIIFSRQSGKDELAANLKAYLMARFIDKEVGIVEVNPTYKPQTINAIDRLEDRLSTNLLTRIHWHKRSDFMRKFGKVRVSFLSGDSQANVVGAVASLLMIVNEAQDIQPEVYDKRFAPMVASTNATRVMMGTPWTSQTLLARELRAARQAEKSDGIRRVFQYDAKDVGKILPAYKKHVAAEIAKLGREHPLIKTQYFNEEIDAQAGMFNAARRALMKGDQDAQLVPIPGTTYVFLLDIAGQDEAAMAHPEDAYLRNPGRDAVSLSICALDLSMLNILQAPIYRAICRLQWTGRNHLVVFGQLKALADQWRPQYIVADATGVGEGLWAMLDKAYPTRVLPVKFSAPVKSDIGYRFIGIIETGRFRDCCPTPQIDRQYEACMSEVLIGPQKTLRWGVPEGTRDQDGNLIHDDYLMADALCAEVDRLQWYLPVDGEVITGRDPLKGMDRNF